MEKEIWKDIPNYEGYYKISTKGRVKSIDRIILKSNGVKMRLKGVFLVNMKSHYPMVNLTKQSKGSIVRVHILMAITFLNHTPSRNIVVDHKDNNPFNNKLSNLQLTTTRLNTSKDRKGGSSKYIGVVLQKNRWVARIRHDGKRLYLGGFCNEYDAHLAYQNKLKEIQNISVPK